MRNPRPGGRPEMKGPSDISDLLSGLKTKRVNIQKPGESKSTISVTELKEMKDTDLSGAKKIKTAFALGEKIISR